MAFKGRKIGPLQREQLNVIYCVSKKVPSTKVAGGWAVEGLYRKFADDAKRDTLLRSHENVDFLVSEEYLSKMSAALNECGMETHGLKGGNLRGTKKDGPTADVIVLHPISYRKKQYWVYETPYHNPGVPVPVELLEGTEVAIGNVSYRALNATALYLAKLTAKSLSAKDKFDLTFLEHMVDNDVREQLRFYAKV